MHQWDIVQVRVNPKDRDAHPAVVISCEEDCRDAEFLRVNVLYGSKRPPAATLEPWQILLNGSRWTRFSDFGGLRRHLSGAQNGMLSGDWQCEP
jgi:hypothetical protein